MCYFIVAALPEKADIAYISEIFCKHGRKLDSTEMTVDGPSISDNFKLFYTCKGSCDCGTSIGSHANSPEQQISDAHEIDKLKKKGWSQSKINRWIESKKVSLEEKDRKRVSDEENSAININQWIMLIREVVNSGSYIRLGLILLWAPKQHNHLIKKITVSLSELSPDMLRKVEEQVLYEFVVE